jgi:protein gp37
MPGTSKIEWTEATWNPVTGCTKVSPGCDHCYAETFAERWRGIPGHPYEQGFDLRLWPERLNLPRSWREPRVVFVNSMSDLFHARVPYEFVEHVWATMAATPRHTYQVLTKRPDRMQRFSQRLAERFGVLPNVWLGTSVESQEYVARVEHLARSYAKVRFVSAEPLLGPLNLVRWLEGDGIGPHVDWVIIGGESGHGARPCDIEWIRDLRDQCRAAHVACFVKQLGSVLASGRGKGGDQADWPEDIRVREMPLVATGAPH